jgi:hypothetical protein
MDAREFDPTFSWAPPKAVSRLPARRGTRWQAGGYGQMK